MDQKINEILSQKQKQLLPLLKQFSDKYGLVGGTAVAFEFNEKLFREQLSYFEDIDYSEEVDYLPGFSATDE